MKLAIQFNLLIFLKNDVNREEMQKKMIKGRKKMKLKQIEILNVKNIAQKRRRTVHSTVRLYYILHRQSKNLFRKKNVDIFFAQNVKKNSFFKTAVGVASDDVTTAECNA